MKKEDAKEALRWLLGQVKRAKAHKKELIARLQRIVEERESCIKSPSFDAMPKVSGISDGAASYILKYSEVEERIQLQSDEIDKTIMCVMDIIEFIPQYDVARRILELRYLDCLNMNDIAKTIPMAKSRCYEIYNHAIDTLIEIPEVAAMVEEREGEYAQWYVNNEIWKAKKQSRAAGSKIKSRKKKYWKK